MRKLLGIMMSAAMVFTHGCNTQPAHAQEAVKAAEKKPLSSASELDYLRGYGTFAVSETRAYSAQAELTAAQSKFNEAKAAYAAEQATFQKSIQDIMKRDGCASIDHNNGHPMCVLAAPKK